MNRRFVGMGSVIAVVAALSGVAAALGIFARGDGTYAVVTSPRGVTYEMATSGVYAFNAQRVVAEGVGWDVFTLVVMVPMALVAAAYVARGSYRGRLVAAGVLAYFFYQYLEYSVTWAFGPLFPLFIVIYATSLAGLVWIGASLARDGLAGRFSERFPRRSFALLTGAMATLLSLMWTQRIATGLGGDLEAAALWGETTMVVQALDLGLVVPAAVFVAVMTWRRTPLGYVLAAVYIVASGGMAGAIGAMLLSAWAVEGSLELVPIVIFGAYVAAAVALAWLIYMRSWTPGSEATPPERRRVAPAGRPA